MSESRPIAIGVSACLDGRAVRYDGRAFDVLAPIREEPSRFRVFPACPEVMAGMGVPRPRIRLTGPGEGVLDGRASAVDEHGLDVTERLVRGCRACVDEWRESGVVAAVLKERSPSCGLFEAPVDSCGDDAAAGVLGALVRREGWLGIPSTALEDPDEWREWRSRLLGGLEGAGSP